MTDRTRPSSENVSAGAFAWFVCHWLESHEPLIDALAVLRKAGDERQATEALSAVRRVAQLREAWELWQLWADIGVAEADERLRDRLGEQRIAHLRFAIWGHESKESSLPVPRLER